MALDTPLLERSVADEKTETASRVLSARTVAETEDVHNANINEVYRRLINPDSKIEDVFVQREREDVGARTPSVEKSYAPVAPAAPAEQLYRAPSARVDSDLFRADSAINRRLYGAVATEENLSEEEEDEDLRPTATTIQYRTASAAHVHGKVEARTEQKKSAFTKKQKITAAVLIAVVVALIAIIIINSSIIANLHTEIAQLDYKITAIRPKLQRNLDELSNVINTALESAQQAGN